MSDPASILCEFAAPLPPGCALDLACGSGRHALWLAERGWRVTAVDRSPGVPPHPFIETRVFDFEHADFAIEPAKWDLVIQYLYLDWPLLERAKLGVKPGGLMIAAVLCGGEGRFRAQPGELRGHFDGWEIVSYRESDRAEIAARKT